MADKKEDKEEAKKDDPKAKDKGEGEGSAEGGEGEAPKKSKKKLLLILAPVLLLILGGVGFFLFGGGKTPPAEGEEAGEHGEKIAEHAAFYDLPDILVNLSTQGQGKNFLKLSVSLELEDELDLPKIQKLEPRIVDKFQVYLRGLSIQDFEGTEGVYRLREELLARVNATVEPLKVSQVLFKEILVQ